MLVIVDQTWLLDSVQKLMLDLFSYLHTKVQILTIYLDSVQKTVDPCH